MGQFDLDSKQFKCDPLPMIEILQRAGSVVEYNVSTLGRCFVTTTHVATSDLLKDTDRFVMEPRNAGQKTFTWWWKLAPRQLRGMSKNILQSDEPDHRRLRNLVDKAFRGQNIADLRQGIETLSERYLDQLESGSNEPKDFLELVARRLPLTVICEMLGIPEGDRYRLTDVFVDIIKKTNNPLGILLIMPRFKKLFDYLERLFVEVRKNPQPGLISALVHAEENGDQLNEDELLTMVFVLFLAGHETTVHLLSGSLWALSRFPEERARLQADPSLLDTGVDEFLRYVSPVMMTKPRFVKEDMNFHGAKLKKGDRVVASLISANYDARVFADPAQLDLSRASNPHMSLGRGSHFCLGSQLAKMEVRIVLRRLFERFPGIRLAVEEGQVAWYKGPFMRAMGELPVVANP